MSTLFQTVTTRSSQSSDEELIVSFNEFIESNHQILIEELTLEMSIGILDHEKKNKQRVILDLEISLNEKESYGDDISQTVSYAEIIEKIKTLATSKHFNLVETLSEDIASECMNYAAVTKTKVTVKKPDIISEAKSVGFSMTREKAI